MLCIDSGASTSAGPKELAPKLKLKETAASKRGRQFKAACGTWIPDQGSKEVPCVTVEEGEKLDIAFATTSVHKPLVAVSELSAAGCATRMEKGNSWIRLPSKRQLKLRESKGLYLLPVWLPPNTGGVADMEQLVQHLEENACDLGFERQEGVRAPRHP